MYRLQPVDGIEGLPVHVPAFLLAYRLSQPIMLPQPALLPIGLVDGGRQRSALRVHNVRIPLASRSDSDADHPVTLLNGIHNVLTVRHLSEHRVPSVQMRCRQMGDEELTAIRIRPGVGH